MQACHGFLFLLEREPSKATPILPLDSDGSAIRLAIIITDGGYCRDFYWRGSMRIISVLLSFSFREVPVFIAIYTCTVYTLHPTPDVNDSASASSHLRSGA